MDAGLPPGKRSCIPGASVRKSSCRLFLPLGIELLPWLKVARTGGVAAGQKGCSLCYIE